MTIGPIDSGAHDPDLVEQVLSIMLLQERPRAWRRERSRGDAGVDVADRIAGGFEVIQITSFTGSLTSRRKSDIEKSFDAALAGGELNGPIVSRQLLLPMDQSKEAAVCRAGEDRCFEMLWATMIRLIPDLPGRKVDMVLGKRLQPNHGDG